MPSWKKVILSGSDAALNSLTVSNGITSSLFGTASWAVSASQAITASYANFALTASNSQNAQDILIYVKNTTGAQINKGKVVRISGATGDNALISTASYESDPVSANTLGITYQNIPNDSFGYVITEGTLLGINTDAFSAGQLLYLGAAGAIIGTAPVAPLHSVRLGQVLRVQQNNGSMYVRIDNGYELGELHDVVDTTTASSYGDLLVKSGSVWTNSRQLTGSYALTGSLQATSFTGSLFGTASYALTSSFLNSTTNAFIQNGNSFGTQALLGTNDNQNLALETSGSIRMFISSSGNIGIGKTTPNATLDVNGNTIITGSTILNGLQTFQGTTASDTAPLGSELLTTGTGDASWTGVSFATGYTHVTGSTTALTSSLAGVVSTFYQIAYTITGRTAGSITIAFGGQSIAGVTATGTFGPRATTTDTLTITPTTDFNGTIVLSIKTIGTSSATTTLRDSTGVTTNEIRVSNIASNTFIGLNAGTRNTTGIVNSFFGQSAGQTNTTGGSNSFFGQAAGSNNTTGANNSFFGRLAGTSNTTGGSNTAIGVNALFSNTTGGSNIAIGVNALFSNTTANNNTAIGLDALRFTTTGASNTAIGLSALRVNTTGSNNTSVGAAALFSNTTGGSNTSIGVNALFNLATGSSNTAIGFDAARRISGGTNLTTSNNSVFLGQDTRALADNQTNQIVIGHTAIGLGSNTVVLGNSSIVTTALRGSVGIGTTSPNATLDVNGNTIITGSLSQGNNNVASGSYSHAEGNGTVALGSFQHVQGQFNISSSAQSAFIIGNGTSSGSRSNLVFASGSQFQVTGSLIVRDILQLAVRTTTPTPIEGMIIASGSAGSSVLYYYNGTSWNALF